MVSFFEHEIWERFGKSLKSCTCKNTFSLLLLHGKKLCGFVIELSMFEMNC